MVSDARLGTAHNGLSEWYLQRVSAVVLALLLPALFVLLMDVYSGGLNQMELLSLLDNFAVRMLHTLLLLALLTHGYLGIKVIVEDYVHYAGLRIALMVTLLMTAASFGIWWLSIIWAWAG